MSVEKHLKEQILLLKIKHGDAGAYAEVYDQYVEPIYRYILFRTPTAEVAQDLTADVFLKVWERLSAGYQVSNLKAYLYQVARNLITDHYRQNQEIALTESVIEANQELATASDVNSRLTLAEIEKSLRQLKPEWQEVVILVHVEGLSLKEAAVIIGRSGGATRALLHRALKELKRLLNKDNE
ncbi:MAG: RNA polymerase sigma factor [Patescibacteria group bacterium]